MARRSSVFMLALLLLVPVVSLAQSPVWKQYQQQIRLRHYSQAAQLITPLAQQKDAEACYQLAQLYRNGTGVPADAQKARRLLQTAAEQGHVDSEYLLGVFFSKGIGGDKNLPQARYWLQQAVSKHHRRAARVLEQLGDAGPAVALTAEQVKNAAQRGDTAVLHSAISAHQFLGVTDANGNSLLAMAVANGRQSAAELLITQRDLLNRQNRNGETPLHLAVETKNIALVSALLASSANPNLRNAAGKTVLHLAVDKNSPELVTALLKAKADPGLRDKDGETPVDKARLGQRQAVLAAFAAVGVSTKTSSPLQQRVAAARQSQGAVSPLQLAVERGDRSLVRALLKEDSDPWRANAQGNTVITLAAGLPNTDILNDLLAQSHGTGWIGIHGRNALFNAIAAGREKNLDSLLAHHVDPLQTDVEHQNAIEFALASGSALSIHLLNAVPAARWQAAWLPVAARQGLLDVTMALVRSGVDVNARDREGRTALWYAASQGQVKVLDALLLKGADPGIADQAGNTPLHKAAGGSHPEVVSRLLPDIQQRHLVDAVNRDGITPLLLAASAGRSAQVKLLLEAQADKDQRDRNGNTPLMLAVMAHDASTVKLLLEAGASMKKRNQNKQNALAMARQLNYQDIVELLTQADQQSGVLSIFH